MRTETFTILENENDLESHKIILRGKNFFSVVELFEVARKNAPSDTIAITVLSDIILDYNVYVNKNLLIGYLMSKLPNTDLKE